MKRKWIIIIVCLLSTACLTAVIGSICVKSISDSAFSALYAGNTDELLEIVSRHPWTINKRRHMLFAELFPAVIESNPTLFQEACRYADADVVDGMIEKGAKLNNADRITGKTPLISELESGKANRFELAEKLIEHGSRTNARSIGGDVLSYSVRITQNDDPGAAEEYLTLLLKKADEEGTIFNYPSALKWAAICNNLYAIKTLHDRGADMNESEYEKTALMYAAERGFSEACELLVGFGADKALKDQEGKTAYDYALNGGYSDLAAFLDPTA